MKSLFKNLKAIDQSQDSLCVNLARRLTSFLLSSTIFTGTSFSLAFSILGQALPAAAAGTNYCQSPYGEVYGTVTPKSLYLIHPPTGASALLTTSTFSVAAINGMATDHVNKLVYYGDANNLYAWNALTNQHILITNNFSSFIPSSYTHAFTTLSSGGAAFYNGSLYVGVDGNAPAGANPDFEIFKIDFVAGSNGTTIQTVTPLNIAGNSGGGLVRTNEDWGDFTISDTGIILALTSKSGVAHLWNYNLNTNQYTNIGAPTGGNHQFAKSGDGKLWALFSSGNVQEILPNGTYTGTTKTTISVSDGGECVVGNATVGDRVWADVNGNGIQDAGESGIAGVSVSIYRDINKNGVLDAGEPLLATQTTDANGNYNFTELLPHDMLTGTGHNDFIVQITGGVPTGYTATTATKQAVDLSSATQTITTVDFGYKPPTVTISGAVFDDRDGGKLQNGTEAGTNGAGLNAVLINSSNQVVATTAVPISGIYTFSNVPANANYTVQITTATATVGSAPPAITLPSNWVSTGENLNSTIDGTVDGKLSVSVTTTNVTGANFGIEQLPDTTAVNGTSQTNPGGTTKVQVPTLAGTDPEDGALGSGKSFKIVTLPTNGTLYYNGTAVTVGQVITNYDPTKLTIDPNDGAITVSFTYAAIDAAGKEDPTPATVTMPFTTSITAATVTLSGTVFSDADADVTINGSDAGTNAGSANLTIYAVDAAGKVVDKATVAANGTYTLTNVPENASVTLRLSNDSTVAIGATAPTSPSLATGWFHTGKNLNGTIDGAIATLGDIALTTTATNVTNQNFGIRQSYVITPDPAPNICNPDYTGALTTGISASGGQLSVGSNDLNWTVEWIQGPSTSGVDTPYALPRPVGVMPAVVVGNLATGAWLNEPANARWISYPFRLSTNGNGYHSDANLNGISSELSSATPGGTTDAVRLKFTSTVTLPSNANTVGISLPIGVAVDNQFVSIKINGVENLVPVPTPNAQAPGFFSTSSVNLTKGWQPGVNTIEIVIDSGPDYVGFFLKVEATTTQVCSPANVLLVKRITAINGTPINKYVDDTTSTKKDDDSHPNWPAPLNSDSNLGDTTISSFLQGVIDGGTVKPDDEVEYTIYFLATGNSPATNVNFCDLVPANVTFIPTAFTKKTPGDSGIAGADAGIELTIGNTTTYLTNVADGDRGEYFAPGTTPSVKCPSGNGNGAVVVKVVNSQAPAPNDELPNATAPGTPTGSYGFIRFRGRVK
jgi:uncharacterized repeat protein (TIGR01451 family)